MRLTAEKLSQAIPLVQDAGVNLWLTFVRETANCGDPVLPLILDGGLTWESALMVTRSGTKIAIVGNYDADPLIASGDWDEVIPYVQGIRTVFLETLDKICGPKPKIAVNFAEDNYMADGLSHGMFLILESCFAGTRFEGCLVSSSDIVSRLRSLKTATEIARIENAIKETDKLFDLIGSIARVGITEREIYDAVQKRIAEKGFGYAWDKTGDPIVNCGPDSMIGHGIPSATLQLAEGHILHVDLGIVVDGYASDIQSCWFVGSSVPDDVARALGAVIGAITAGSEVLKPGVQGWEVDAAARSFLVSAGYPEYLHAFGHQVGRVAHDGGALLGPKWERYGQLPMIAIEAGQVFTLELGIEVEGRGYLGIEEMVLVTEDGIRWLSNRQLDMPLISGS